MLGELGIQEQSRITGYIDEIDFFRYLKAADVVVNLRYPTAGETSGTLIRTLGAGKPVIVSDFGQFADFPEDICLKVAPGENEERDLYSVSAQARVPTTALARRWAQGCRVHSRALRDRQIGCTVPGVCRAHHWRRARKATARALPSPGCATQGQ